MLASEIPAISEISSAGLGDVDISAIIAKGEPVILRGAYSDHPLVKAGLQSAEAAKDVLAQYYNDKPLTSFIAAPEHKGRFFYKPDMSAMNFDTQLMPLADFFEKLSDVNDPRAFYAGSTDMQTYFPNMFEDLELALTDDVFTDYPPIVSLWLGNQTSAAIHYDMSNNIAASMVGHRRFTLFPPSEIENLYPGPLFPTPAGQVVSLVDLWNPDYAQYPNFKKALSKAQSAELAPGDVLIYPAMWWHQVDALDEFNVLINYWWNEAPKFMDSPMTLILLSILALRDRPQAEKEAWKGLMDYYIFQDPETARAHIPQSAQGLLGPIDVETARRLRLSLLNKLNR